MFVHTSSIFSTTCLSEIKKIRIATVGATKEGLRIKQLYIYQLFIFKFDGPDSNREKNGTLLQSAPMN